MNNNIENYDDEQKAPIRSYTTQELADLYKIHTRTFRRWLVPHKHLIGDRVGHFYSIKQVKVIFTCLERPFVD